MSGHYAPCRAKQMGEMTRFANMQKALSKQSSNYYHPNEEDVFIGTRPLIPAHYGTENRPFLHSPHAGNYPGPSQGLMTHGNVLHEYEYGYDYGCGIDNTRVCEAGPPLYETCLTRDEQIELRAKRLQDRIEAYEVEQARGRLMHAYQCQVKKDDIAFNEGGWIGDDANISLAEGRAAIEAYNWDVQRGAVR